MLSSPVVTGVLVKERTFSVVSVTGRGRQEGLLATHLRNKIVSSVSGMCVNICESAHYKV